MKSNTGTTSDLHLSGMGKAPGGTYRTASISGVGAVAGDLEAERLTIGGVGAIKGNVAAHEARVSGTGNIKGDLDAEHLEVSGMVVVGGDVRSTRARISGCAKAQRDVEADELEVSGSANIQGNVRAAAMTLSGSANVHGSINARVFGGSGTYHVGRNVDAGEFRSSGVFDIGGRVAADVVEIRPNGPCTVDTVVGKTVSVIDDPNRLGCNREDRRLTVDSIAASEISLELTTADTVRGRVVRIGPGCEIDTVEYGESLDADPAAEVRHTRHTGTTEEEHEPH